MCIWLGVVEVAGVEVAFPRLTLVVEFLVMAAVLIWRPWGLMGRPQAVARGVGAPEAPLRRAGQGATAAWCALVLGLALLPLAVEPGSYATVLLTDIAIAALFAASLHCILGPGGLHSFGHAAYFGLGAYGAALLVRWLDWPMGTAL